MQVTTTRTRLCNLWSWGDVRTFTGVRISFHERTNVLSRWYFAEVRCESIKVS